MPQQTRYQLDTYLTLLCCRSPRVVSRECGGMESRMLLPKAYTSESLL
jgi:hypothetical protein